MASWEQSTLASWDETFTRQLERVATLTADLSPEQLNTRPAPKEWGIAHCLEHLTVTLKLYHPYLEGALEKAEQKGGTNPPEYRPGCFARWFFGFLKPGTRRVPAPKKFRPVDDPPPGAVERFRTELEGYQALLTRADRVNVNGTKFRSPITPLFRFSIGEGFELMVLHQDRHLDQIERTRAAVIGDSKGSGASEGELPVPE